MRLSESTVLRWGLLFFLLMGASVRPLSALGWRAGNLPGSAGAMALAGGGVALAPDITLVTINPAHVWGARVESIEYGYLHMFGDLQGHRLRWHSDWREQPTQLFLSSLEEDDIELRGDIPTRDPLGYFSAHLLTVELLRGWQLGKTQVGIGLGFAYQRIFEYDARGVWLSAGWRGQLLSGVNWGLVLRQVGMGEALGQTRDPLALQAGAGLAFDVIPELGQLALDLWYDRIGDVYPTVAWSGGGEVLQLKAGMRIAPDALQLALGFQLVHRRWIIAYGMSFQSHELGQPYMLTVSRSI